MREHLPASVQDRFVFVNADVKDIDMSVPKKELIKAWGGDARLCEITHVHWSPPCTSTSRASRGAGGHRNLDGSARSPTAIADDFALERGVELCKRLSRVVPTALFTIENPVNDVFPFFPGIRRLLDT